MSKHGEHYTARAWSKRHPVCDVAILRKGNLTRITESADVVNFALEDGWVLVSVFKAGKKRQLRQQSTLSEGWVSSRFR